GCRVCKSLELGTGFGHGRVSAVSPGVYESDVYFTLRASMRLTKLKIAGFKSFVDPTTVTFPSSLTGVVGPNGCGKSNIIDAVRWVMGEISAKHLRGESMADVIFNGSASRKPLGNASVELVFDNSDGKIGGPYASYNEVALKRAVSRDGTSDYFINGLKVRRKDITQLFLGTGLGTRSYAIIEQGMISRVIEARPDDLREFLEEAAGISRYKERRRETESRIGHTRENLDRLNDLREEVEKQIRHLQRQAATARRYQTLKEEERKLSAELLALRLQSLDLEAGVRDAATSGCETAMQAVLADLREAEAQIERIRADQSAKADALNAIQGRYYEAGAEVTRIEQGIEYARELRARQRADLEQIDSQTGELDRVVQLDRVQLESLSMELSTMVPGLDEAHERERVASQGLERGERALTSWQFTWDNHAQAVALGQRETQVERARIEQLESQQRRLLQQQERQESEREAFAQQQPPTALESLAGGAGAARAAAAAARARGMGERSLCAAAAADGARNPRRARRCGARSGRKCGGGIAGTVVRDLLDAGTRARAQSVAQYAACPFAAGPGRAGIDRSAAAGCARQSLRPGHAMAPVAGARPPPARRAARAGGQGLGARGRDCVGFVSRGGVRRWPRQRHGSVGKFRRRLFGGREHGRWRRRHARRRLAAGKGARRDRARLGAVGGIDRRDAGRGAQTTAPAQSGRVCGHSRRNLAGQRLVARVARRGWARRSDRARGKPACHRRPG